MPDRDNIPTTHDPAALAAEFYPRWLADGVFTAHAEHSDRSGGTRVPFTIVMPPPNVTGVLHMGHGLNNTVQDVLIRWRRMAGDEALWAPGTDHAGIATQNIVEKQIARDGLTRFDLGRDAFVSRVEDWVSRTGGQILSQLRSLGASADWTRTAYTLDPERSRAVREAFVRLYEKGLVYRGHRVIHWCSRCLTSLSDEEAEFQDETGRLYHVRYGVAGEPGRFVEVATTRPETMLGDVAVAVHPEDERYRDLVGKSVILPVTGIEIPVVADEYTDPEFGTGVVKITPAHDPNDFEVGRRHSLPMPVIMSPEGTMQEWADAEGRVPASLRGVDRMEARERMVQMLRESGELVKVEPHEHAVRHCYRCNTVVEPRLSDQWFVRMAPLAEPALEAVRSGEIRILPERWEGVYVHWMENIRDWNISRQLWWGHRIPVWYCDACNETIASRENVEKCVSCGGAVRQDEDVLDTWFSSWLWPFSTLGWPDEDSPDLQAFYPTDVLVTAPEILFFWVARMIMAGYEFMGKRPFHTVYLHGTVRDTNHVRMQKSLGNGIDPLDVVQLFGADALRFTVVAGLGVGTDLILDPKDLERSFSPGRNFATKLWNIGRFLLTNVGSAPVSPLSDIAPERLTRADRWILSRLDAAIAECNAALGPARPDGERWKPAQLRQGMRLNEYAEAARSFVWNELADWYVETTKSRMQAGDADAEVARAVSVHVFDGALRLLQPIMPFVTEALWQRLPGRKEGEYIATAAWPCEAGWTGDAAAREFERVRDAVSAIRQIRSDYNIPPGSTVEALIVPASVTDGPSSGQTGESAGAASGAYAEEAALIGRLSRASVHVGTAADGGAAAHAVLSDQSQLIVPLGGVVDVEKECAKLRNELAQLEKQLASLQARLANESFVSRAPAAVVEGERAKAVEWTARRDALAAKVSALCGA